MKPAPLFILLYSLAAVPSPAQSVSDRPEGSIDHFVRAHSSGAIDQSRWMEFHMQLRDQGLRTDVLNGFTGDFNDDGYTDLMLATRRGIQVAWNSEEGLANFAEVLVPLGELTEAQWDPKAKALWTHASYPDRIESWTFSAETLSKTNQFEGHPVSMRISPGLGLTTLGRQGQRLELLRIDGETETIIAESSQLQDAVLLEPCTRCRLLILQDDKRGNLGLAIWDGEQWNPTEWWPETGGTENWFVKEREDGSIATMGNGPSNIWLKSISQAGQVVAECEPSTPFARCQFWPILTDNPDVVEFVARRRVTYSVWHVQMDAHTGEVQRLTSLTEIDKLPFVLTPDLDRDGHAEILYPESDKAGWTCHTNWASGTRRLLWTVPHQGSAQPLQSGHLSQLWLDAMSPLDSLEECWTHRGSILTKQGGQWHRIQSRANQPPLNLGLSVPATGDSCFQLHVPYLDFANSPHPAWGPRIAELTAREWQHLVFIRRKDLHTEVWLNGQCVFLGKSLEAGYLYNALLFGASFGTHYREFGAVSLDRVALSGRQWTPEDILQEFRQESVERDPYLTEQWNFEGFPFQSDLANSPMDAQDSPKQESGTFGYCATFDGTNDALRAFVPVPTEELTLSFFFRINVDRSNEPQSTVGLYGMHNTNFLAVWGDRSELASPRRGDSLLVTPTLTERSALGVPHDAHAFMFDGHLHFLSPSGGMFEEGVLGWQETDAPPTDEAEFGAPWVSDGKVHSLDDRGFLWSWHPDQGWELLQNYAELAESQTIQTRHGLFVTQGNEWKWADADMKRIQSPFEELPSPSRIDWSFEGDLVTLGDGVALEWHSKRRQLAMAPAQVFYDPPSGSAWYWIIFLLAMSIGVAIWRGYARSKAHTKNEPPPEILANLLVLIEAKEAEFDTLGFDELLGNHEFQTDETRRARRSRFIRECNQWSEAQWGMTIVERQSDPQDRRRTIYVINPALKETMSSMKN